MGLIDIITEMVVVVVVIEVFIDQRAFLGLEESSQKGFDLRGIEPGERGLFPLGGDLGAKEKILELKGKNLEVEISNLRRLIKAVVVEMRE